MAFCSSCGTQVADGTSLCAACSSRVPAATVQAGGGLTDNVAGMLAYITIIPAIIFLVMAPYNKSRFVRFHAFQSIFFLVGVTVLCVAVSIVGMVPVVGLITLFLLPMLGLGALIVWIILLMKANQGQMFKLPVIGDMAEKQANAAV
jgi:uncharacterized membrane protein